MRKNLKRAWLAAVSFSLLVPSQAYAVSKINKVNVKFITEDYTSDGLPQVEAVTKESAHYQVAFCESAEEYYGQEADDPYEDNHSYEDSSGVYVVELTTDDEYQFRFSSSDKEKIRISGMGAVLVKANQEDNGHTLRLTVHLDDLEEYVGQIEYAAWNGCKGEWGESQYAAGYRLRLCDPKGKYHYAETAGTNYDFAPLMLTAGTYWYDVRAISRDGKYGEWIRSGNCTITEETVMDNLAVYEVKTVNRIIDENKAHTPDNNRIEYLNIGWQKTDSGEYWYRDYDGTYPQHIWKQIDGSWYYFGDSGYMVHDTYLNWKNEECYMSIDGRMLTDDYAPDGRWADKKGVLMKEMEK